MGIDHFVVVLKRSRFAAFSKKGNVCLKIL